MRQIPVSAILHIKERTIAVLVLCDRTIRASGILRLRLAWIVVRASTQCNLLLP
jgi:hypothetical protein